MGGVKAFYEKLSGREKDVFTAMTTDLQASSRKEKVVRLQEFLAQLKSEIDEINRRRKAAGDMLDNVVIIRLAADRGLDPVKGGTPDLDLELLRDYLVALEQGLKEEIAELRPERKLEKKFDVARRIESLICRSSLAERLQVEVLGKKSNPAVDGSDVRTKHVEMTDRRGESTPEVEKEVQATLAGKMTDKGPGFPVPPVPDPVVGAEEEEDDGR